MQTYLINTKIFSFFLSVDDADKAVADFWVEYMLKIKQLQVKTTVEYLESKGFAEEQILEKLDKIDNQEFDEDLNATEEYSALLDEKINNYNKLIYETFGPKMQQEQKDKMNNYIKEQQAEINNEFDKVKQEMLEMLGDLEKEALEMEKNGNDLDTLEEKIKQQAEKIKQIAEKKNAQEQSVSQTSTTQAPPAQQVNQPTVDSPPQLPNISLTE